MRALRSAQCPSGSILLSLAAGLLLLGCPGPSSSDAGVDAGADAGFDAGLLPNTAGWWRHQVIYELFVRSFADSDGDGVGDLRGVLSRLDQLNDGDGGAGSLGVDAIWLMPIYPSPSYHGYDVTDYQGVNPRYGTLADLTALIAGAHARGMRVILDFEPNHSSSQHPWFVNSVMDGSEHRDWYVWRPDDPGWRSPDTNSPLWTARNGAFNYGYFGSSLPDLNYRNPAVEQAIGDAMTYWLQQGVDGFRIDAARYLVESLDAGVTGIADQPQTHEVFQRLRARLAQTQPQVMLVAEAWTEVTRASAYYGQGNEFQLGFSFDLAGSIVNSLVAGTSDDLINTMARTEVAMQGKDRGYEAPFLTNHDQVRVMRQLGGDAAAAKLGAALLMALPGTPFIYYGEEIGMQGGSQSDDKNKRTPMRWDTSNGDYGFSTGGSWYSAAEAAGVDVAAQRADPASLWNRYRKSIAVRHSQPALGGGDATRVTVTGGGQQAFGLLRTSGTSRVLFLANFGTTALGAMSLAVTGAPTVVDSEGLVGAPGSAGGQLTVDGLAPRGFAVFSLGP